LSQQKPRNKVAVGIGIICVALLIAMLAICINYNSIIADKDSEIALLKSQLADAGIQPITNQTAHTNDGTSGEWQEVARFTIDNNGMYDATVQSAKWRLNWTLLYETNDFGAYEIGFEIDSDVGIHVYGASFDFIDFNALFSNHELVQYDRYIMDSSEKILLFYSPPTVSGVEEYITEGNEGNVHLQVEGMLTPVLVIIEEPR